MEPVKSAYMYYDLKEEDFGFEFRLLLAETIKMTCMEELIKTNMLDKVNNQIGLKIKEHILNSEIVLFTTDLIYNEDTLYFVDLEVHEKYLLNIKNICFLETDKWANMLTKKIRPAWVNRHILLCSMPYENDINIFRMTWKT